MLGSATTTDHQAVIADLEAGMGTLLRLGAAHLDVAVVVTEPTAKSMEVGRRLVELATERGIGRVVVVANRISEQAETSLVADRLGVDADAVWPVPDDPAVEASDRDGEAPFDAAPGAPAVVALSGLATHLRGERSLS